MNEVNTWPGWTSVRLLGEGTFGKVYELEKTDAFGTVRSALKVITVPNSRIHAPASAPAEAKAAFCRRAVEKIYREITLMDQLKGRSHIVSYLDHQILSGDDGEAWTVMIRMELLVPFAEYCASHQMTQEEIIGLGMDIGGALETCHAKNILHRDIKPENIFFDPGMGDFALGDFGISRTLEKDVQNNMTMAGTYNYMAPEVFLRKGYGFTADIYSLALVLYELLNDGNPPFCQGASYDVEDRESALTRRFSGESVPPPRMASPALAQCLQKALASDPSVRYPSAGEFVRALEKCREASAAAGSVQSQAAGSSMSGSGTVYAEYITGGELPQEERGYSTGGEMPQEERRHISGGKMPQEEPRPADRQVPAAEESIREAAGRSVQREEAAKDSDGIPQDPAQAAEYFRRSAIAGSVDDMRKLGTMYIEGTGVPQDYAQAMEWFRRAAEAGSAEAMNNMGVLYRKGWGAARDDGKAAEWYRKAAEAGSADGMFNLAAIYMNGWGTARDPKEAAIWYRKAAEAGSVRGMTSLGTMYRKGLGIAQDSRNAVMWYRKAAEAGSAEAMCSLGGMYLEGRGVEKDAGTAIEWFRRAADAGYADAMNNLGVLYRKGWGIPKDEKKAAEWYKRAAAAGSSTARKNLESLRRENTGAPHS